MALGVSYRGCGAPRFGSLVFGASESPAELQVERDLGLWDCNR